MRIWHEQLIPKLCRQHLLAMWREGLGAYKIITEDKKGYRNHPAVKEFEDSVGDLTLRLTLIRIEMIKRGYKPKELPWNDAVVHGLGNIKQWQKLEEQVEVLKSKNCECKV